MVYRCWYWTSNKKEIIGLANGIALFSSFDQFLSGRLRKIIGKLHLRDVRNSVQLFQSFGLLLRILCENI